MNRTIKRGARILSRWLLATAGFVCGALAVQAADPVRSEPLPLRPGPMPAPTPLPDTLPADPPDTLSEAAPLAPADQAQPLAAIPAPGGLPD